MVRDGIPNISILWDIVLVWDRYKWYGVYWMVQPRTQFHAQYSDVGNENMYYSKFNMQVTKYCSFTVYNTPGLKISTREKCSKFLMGSLEIGCWNRNHAIMDTVCSFCMLKCRFDLKLNPSSPENGWYHPSAANPSHLTGWIKTWWSEKSSITEVR